MKVPSLFGLISVLVVLQLPFCSALPQTSEERHACTIKAASYKKGILQLEVNCNLLAFGPMSIPVEFHYTPKAGNPGLVKLTAREYRNYELAPEQVVALQLPIVPSTYHQTLDLAIENYHGALQTEFFVKPESGNIAQHLVSLYDPL